MDDVFKTYRDILTGAIIVKVATDHDQFKHAKAFAENDVHNLRKQKGISTKDILKIIL